MSKLIFSSHCTEPQGYRSPLYLPDHNDVVIQFCRYADQREAGLRRATFKTDGEWERITQNDSHFIDVDEAESAAIDDADVYNDEVIAVIGFLATIAILLIA